MKKIVLFFLLIPSLSVIAQEDPYGRNKPSEEKNGRKTDTQRPDEQKQNGEVKEKVEPNYQSGAGKNVNNNEAMVNGVAGILQLFAMMTDEYSTAPTTLKAQLGIGYSQLPLIVNSTNYSTTEKIYTLDPILGLNLGIFKNKAVSFNLKPRIYFKFPGVIKGNSGMILDYGGDLVSYISTNAKSKLKFFAHLGYQKISGNFESDGSNGDPFSATLKYDVKKIGAGLMLHLIDGNQEFWIKPGVFLEKPSFLKSSQAPIKTASLNINIKSQIEIDFSISKNTYIGGEIYFPRQFIPKNQTFYNITIIRNGKLF